MTCGTCKLRMWRTGPPAKDGRVQVGACFLHYHPTEGDHRCPETRASTPCLWEPQQDMFAAEAQKEGGPR
jgi:hypothetical protein